MMIHIDTRKFAAAVNGEFPDADICARPIPFRIGARVRIKNSCDGKHSYHGQYVGCTGVIERIPEVSISADEVAPEISIGVRLDDKYNERSQYGCYWFKPEELTVITEIKENTEMLLLKGYKTVRVDVMGNDVIAASYESDLEEGDAIVVTTGSIYLCGTVVATDGFVTSSNTQPKYQVVCKVDDDAYIKRCDKVLKAKELEKKLEDAAKEYQKVALYEMMAEKSPAIASLLAEYKELDNG